MHIVCGHGWKLIDFRRCHLQNGCPAAILNYSFSGLQLLLVFEYQVQTSLTNYMCVWEWACWFSAISLSKWPSGGHIGFFNFWALTSAWLWISSPNFSSTLLVYMERTLLIFRALKFGFEHQIQYSGAPYLCLWVDKSLVIFNDVQSTYCPLLPILLGGGILVDHWSTISSLCCNKML